MPLIWNLTARDQLSPNKFAANVAAMNFPYLSAPQPRLRTKLS